MAGPLKAIGKITGIAAAVVAIFNPVAGAILAAVSLATTTLGNALTKPPPARGSITQITVDPDPPQPYVMGRGYFAGVLRHDCGYGPTLDEIPNPYRFMAVVYSGGGPVQSIAPRVDFAVKPSWFNGFLFTDVQLGACPEAGALAPEWSGAPGWGASSKLSGQAAIGWSLKFDKKGERFASGLPVMGAEGDWVKVYDPRLDSTRPGGSGSHRLGVESTYTWSENPALHAGTYAFGRYQNGKRTFGVGLSADAIDWDLIAAWANVCEANDWTIFGVVWEGGDRGGSQQRWNNLREIALAGGGEPVPLSTLTFRYSAPVVALDTVTEADLTVAEQSVVAMQSFRDRINTAIPKYTSAAHNWELVDGAPVVNATFLAEDGEDKRETWPFNLVRDGDQAAQLAAYRVFDSRELLVTLKTKPRLRDYRPGECLYLDLPDLGLDTHAVILSREIDPATMEVTLELIGETPEKHAFCLGLTGEAPPTPALGQTAEERDQLVAAAGRPAGFATIKLSGSYTRGLAGNIGQAHDGTGTGTVTVTIPDHVRVYGDGTEVTVTGADITLSESTDFLLSYDDATFAGGTLETDFAVVAINRSAGDPAGDAFFSAAHPNRHYLASVTTVDEAGSGGSTGGSSPPGGGGWTGNPDYNQP